MGFTRGRTLPGRAQQYAPLISAGLFLLIVPLRKATLDHNGVALAFAGGFVFKGKSGWYTQFRPMLQVECFYGQSPVLVVRNSHCRPCLGCTRNCYDANPTAAHLHDLHGAYSRPARYRKLFAGAMPWLIVAFFTQPYLAALTARNVLALYGHLLLVVAVGMVVFLLLDALTPFTSYQLIVGHVVVAIKLFYWFAAPLALRQLDMGTTVLSHLIQAGVLAMSLVWLRRALPRERAFLAQRGPRVVQDGGQGAVRVQPHRHQGKCHVRPDRERDENRVE